MKDEIKENCSNCEYNRQCFIKKQLGAVECQKDKDYITNLQEENKRLKEERQNINNRNYNQKIANRKLMEDIEKLRTNLKTNKRRRKKQTHKKNIYKSRNEKAIEYIKSLCYIESKNEWFTYGDDLSPEHIVNILNGDKDE